MEPQYSYFEFIWLKTVLLKSQNPAAIFSLLNFLLIAIQTL